MISQSRHCVYLMYKMSVFNVLDISPVHLNWKLHITFNIKTGEDTTVSNLKAVVGTLNDINIKNVIKM